MIATIALIFSVVLVIALVVLALMHKNNLDEDKNFVPDSVDNKARSIKDKFKAIIRIVKKK
tara:strand:+ start:97 stop:279 length:183 start_codon:yes stop_codon:yes gene_type:complete